MNRSRMIVFLVAAGVLLLAVGTASTLLAMQSFSCGTDQCEATASCSGDYATLEGCTVTCYEAAGGGWIKFSGLARCRAKE